MCIIRTPSYHYHHHPFAERRDPICKLNLASGKHAEQPHNNKKLHNHKMHPRRQTGAAAQPTTMPICDNGQRF